MHNRGFTLIELSIVLVIMGLLVGGVYTGVSMVRAAELRSVPVDIQRYQAAFNAFQEKYAALPGDMANATSYWGIAGGTGNDAACASAAFGATTATCSGDGDEFIGIAMSLSEINHAFQHLSNAGLIEEHFTAPSEIFPKSRVPNARFTIASSTNGGTWGENFSPESTGVILFFGTLNSIHRAAVLKPEDAWGIDQKMDDGFPDSGLLQTDTFFSAACFSGAYPNAVYAVTTTSVECSFRYRIQGNGA